MIRIENLEKYYNSRLVLSIDNLIFEKGKRYALLGTNGSGKSTLIRIIASVIKQDKGRVLLHEGISISYLPQSPYIFDLNVNKNLYLSFPEKTDDIGQHIDRLLKSVGLEEYKYSSAKCLSGGEKQRLAFARVISTSHDLILLDEPTSSMDIVGIENIEEVLEKYLKLTKATLIFSSHEPSQALRLSDEVIFLHRGNIMEFGKTEEVFKNPKTEFVEKYLKYWKL